MKKRVIQLGVCVLVVLALFVGYQVANRARPEQDVLVAAVSIERYHVVTDAEVTTHRRPLGDIAHDALSKPSDAVGHVVLAPISKGDVVRTGNLVAADAIAGRVAITLTTSASSGPEPGTTTDVVVSPRGAGSCGRVFSALLVLASESSGTVVRVTLAVDPADRNALANLVGSSEVTLAPTLKRSRSSPRCGGAYGRSRRAHRAG